MFGGKDVKEEQTWRFWSGIHIWISHRFGIKGNALAWFDSYLKSSKQYVQIEDCQSSQRCLAHGVPQGSVLGPLLYSLYTSPIADIINPVSYTHLTLPTSDLV